LLVGRRRLAGRGREAIMDAGAIRADEVAQPKSWMVWTGRFLSTLGILVIVTSARWKLTRSPFYVAEWARIGYADSSLLGIALLQVTCLVLYLIPRTAVLGMVLLTGYLGGAIATYVRMQEPRPVLVPLTTSLLLWAGLYLREERLRSLLPFRRKALRN
jgi:hypothetical protein